MKHSYLLLITVSMLFIPSINLGAAEMDMDVRSAKLMDITSEEELKKQHDVYSDSDSEIDEETHINQQRPQKKCINYAR